MRGDAIQQQEKGFRRRRGDGGVLQEERQGGRADGGDGEGVDDDGADEAGAEDGEGEQLVGEEGD